MKIEVHFQEIRQTVEVRDAQQALSLFKDEAAARAPIMLRGLIRSLSDLHFAGEVVKRANAAEGRDDELPQSAQQFLDWAVERSYVTVLEP